MAEQIISIISKYSIMLSNETRSQSETVSFDTQDKKGGTDSIMQTCETFFSHIFIHHSAAFSYKYAIDNGGYISAIRRLSETTST